MASAIMADREDRKVWWALSDLCVDIFLLAQRIRGGQSELPPCEALKRRVMMLFEEMERVAPTRSVLHSDVEHAQYALAAHLDEVVQYSDWPGRDEWAQNPLQALLFGESRAGVRFFDRLQQVREQGSPAVLVYYTCLVMGFQGEHRLGDDAVLDRLIAELSREATRSPKVLSAHGKRPDDRGLGQRMLPYMQLAGACLIVALVVTLALYSVITYVGGDAVEVLKQMARR